MFQAVYVFTDGIREHLIFTGSLIECYNHMLEDWLYSCPDAHYIIKDSNGSIYHDKATVDQTCAALLAGITF